MRGLITPKNLKLFQIIGESLLPTNEVVRKGNFIFVGDPEKLDCDGSEVLAYQLNRSEWGEGIYVLASDLH